MSFDTADKKYIETTITRSQETLFQRMKEETDHIVGVHRELIQDDIRKVIEITKDRPTREEVREIVKEEVRPVVREEMNRQFRMALRH